MKKKLAGLLLAFALFVPGVMLTACTEAKVVSIDVQVVNTDYEFADNTITVQWGDHVEFTADDFKVIATLDNQKTKELDMQNRYNTGYTISTTIPATGITPIGQYTVTVEYPSIEGVEFNVDVVKADVDFSNTTWNYTDAIPYDGQPHEVALQNVPSVVTVEYQGTTTATNAGDYVATAVFTLTDTDHYNIPENKVLNWQIAKANLIVTSADQITYEYDGSVKNITAGSFAQLPENVAVAAVSGQTTATDAGTYNITISFQNTLPDAQNYNPIPDLDWTWTITPVALTNFGTITLAEDYDLTYNGLLQTVALDTSGMDASLVRIKETTGLSGTNAQDYQVVVKLEYIGTSPNYSSVQDVVLDWSIEKAPLTISAKPHTITYGAEPANNGLKFDGFVASQTVSVLSGTPYFEYTYQTGNDVGTYQITPSGYASSNYEISFMPGNLTVEKAPLSVTAKNMTIDFGAEAANNGVDVVGLVAGDVLADLGTLIYDYDGYVAGAEAGQYAITVSGLTNGNYEITYYPGVLTVNPQSTQPDLAEQLAQIQLDVDEFTYDGETKVITVNESTIPSTMQVDQITIKHDLTPCDAGEYIAVIELSYIDTQNQTVIPALERDFIINPQEIDVGTLAWTNQSPYTYNGEEQHPTVDVPQNVEVAYQIIKEDIEATPVAIGNYTISAVLSTSSNYQLINDNLQPVQFEIVAQPVDISALVWNSEIEIEYTGQEIAPVLVNVPATVSCQYTYTKNTISISPVDVGEYTASVVIAPINANYEIVGTQPADFNFTITAKQINCENIAWPTQAEFGYTGTAITPELANLPENVEVVYTYKQAGEEAETIEIGSYTATATLSASNSNYTLINATIEDFEFAVVKGTIDLTDATWTSYDVDGIYEYTGEAITPTIADYEDYLGLTVSFAYYASTDTEKTTPIEAIEVGQYVAVATFTYDDTKYELVNPNSIQETTFEIVGEILDGFAWNVDATLLDEYTYSVTLNYNGQAQVIALEGADIEKLDITYFMNGEVESISVTEAGYYNASATIAVKEGETGYLPENYTIYLEITVTMFVFESLTIDGKELDEEEFFENSQRFKHGSVLEFTLKDGFIATDFEGNVITSPITFDNENEIRGLEIYETEYSVDNYINSVHFNDPYFIETFTVNQIDYTYKDSAVVVNLTEGQTSFAINFDMQNYYYGLAVQYIGSTELQTISITDTPITVTNVENIEMLIVMVGLDSSGSRSGEIYIHVNQYIPLKSIVYNVHYFDGTSSSSAVAHISDGVLTGFVATGLNDEVYTDIRPYFDNDLTRAVNLLDLASYHNTKIYLAVYDDQGEYVCTTNATFSYTISTTGVYSINIESKNVMYITSGESTIAITVNAPTSEDFTITSTFGGVETLALTQDVTQTTYRLEITYQPAGQEAKVYFYEANAYVSKAHAYSEFFADDMVYVQNTTAGHTYTYSQGTLNIANHYNAKNITTFEDQLSNFTLTPKSGYTIDQSAIVQILSNFYIKVQLQDAESQDAGFCLITLGYFGTYNDDVSVRLAIYSLIDGVQNLDTTSQEITISNIAVEALMVAPNNSFASVVITDAEDNVVAEYTNGYLQVQFAEAGVYTMTITSVDGTKSVIYTITAGGEFLPMLEFQVGTTTFTMVQSETGISGDFYPDEDDNLFIFAGASSLTLKDAEGYIAVTNLRSSLFTTATLYDQDNVVIPSSSYSSFKLKVVDEATEMPYLTFSASVTMEESMIVYIKIYLVDKPAGIEILSIQLNENVIFTQSYFDFAGTYEGDFDTQISSTQNGVAYLFTKYIGAEYQDSIVDGKFNIEQVEFAYNGTFYDGKAIFMGGETLTPIASLENVELEVFDYQGEKRVALAVAFSPDGGTTQCSGIMLLLLEDA